MTREEAIADIKHAVNWAKENDESWCDGVEVGSLELAIKALEQPEIVHCKDCKHSRPDDSFNFCYRCDFTPGYCHFESGFCERGEAKGQPKDDTSHPFADDVLMALMGGD